MEEMKFDFKFKKFGGVYIDDIGQYLRDYLKENNKANNIRIYVGTDSEQYRKMTRYATVVVLYYDHNGAHYVWTDSRTKKEPDMAIRLWNEVLRTFQLAELLEEELEGYYKRIHPDQKLVDVDIDVNPNPKWKSNSVYAGGVGFFTGSGYRVRTKPNAYAASCAADLIVRKKRKKRYKDYQ